MRGNKKERRTEEDRVSVGGSEAKGQNWEGATEQRGQEVPRWREGGKGDRDLGRTRERQTEAETAPQESQTQAGEQSRDLETTDAVCATETPGISADPRDCPAKHLFYFELVPKHENGEIFTC